MLETTIFYMQASRLLYSAASGAFLLSALSAGVYYLKYKEPAASRHLVLCLGSLIYILGCGVYTYGTPPAELNRILLPALYIIGSTLYLNYAKMLAQLIQVEPRWLPFVTFPIRLLPYLMVLDLILHHTLGYDFLFTSAKDPQVNNWFMQVVTDNITQKATIFLVLIPASISVLFGNILFLVCHRKALRSQILLILGLLFTLLAIGNDLSLTLFDPPYIFPMAFGGFLFEIIRFNIALVENQHRNNDLIKARFKDALLGFSQLRLSKQILHDVKAVRRNLLFSLTQSKKLDDLPQALEIEINRLNIYDNIHLNLPAEKIMLKEICLSTLAFFEKELKRNGYSVKVVIPEEISIFANRNDISIALTNLIQNAMEADSRGNEKWIRFEAFQQENMVVLRVSDSGILSPTVSTKIFRTGFSEKGSQRGFGLSITREALAANAALISLQEDSAHTTFQIEFFKGGED